MKQIALHGRTLCIGDMVRHFKNETNKNLYPYRILLFARSTADQQVCVVYQSMGADKTIWVRPAEEFLSEVDHEKYPNIKQKYRFEVIQEEK